MILSFSLSGPVSHYSLKEPMNLLGAIASDCPTTFSVHHGNHPTPSCSRRHGHQATIKTGMTGVCNFVPLTPFLKTHSRHTENNGANNNGSTLLPFSVTRCSHADETWNLTPHAHFLPHSALLEVHDAEPFLPLLREHLVVPAEKFLQLGPPSLGVLTVNSKLVNGAARRRQGPDEIIAAAS